MNSAEQKEKILDDSPSLQNLSLENQFLVSVWKGIQKCPHITVQT